MLSAHRAIGVAFLLNGIGWASWASRLPAISENLRISEGALGVALLAATAGLFASAVASDRLIHRFGSRRVTVGAGLVMAATLPAIGWSPGYPAFVAALLVFGLGNGAFDVASNAQAVGLERRGDRSILSGIHAFFSGGAIVGAASAALLVAGQVPVGIHLPAVGVVIGLTLLLVAGGLLQDERAPEPPARLALPRGPLLGFAALAFCVLLAEGAVFDWSAVYLTSVAAAPAALAAAGLAIFQAAMLVGRTVGDRLADRFRADRLVRWGTLLGVGGMLLAILLPAPITTLLGYVVLGLGIAASFPLTLSAAARTPGVPAPTAIASTTAAGYVGFVVGPPLIGLVAELSGLRIGLGVVVVVLVAATLLAGRLRREAQA